MAYKTVCLRAKQVLMIFVFIVPFFLLGAALYGLFVYGKSLGMNNFETIVSIFMLASSLSATAQRINKKNK